MKYINFFFLISLFIAHTAHAATTPTVTVSNNDAATSTIAITFDIPPNEFIYKDYLDISIDRPDVELTWESKSDPVTHYDQTFKEDKKIFKDSITITCNATKSNQEIDHAHLHIAYYLNTNKAITETVVPISFMPPTPTIASAIEAQDANIKTLSPITVEKAAPAPNTPIKKQSFYSYVSGLATTTQSNWVRLILVFLLGVLLSLTPCIYPMIPITVGILQSHGSKSIWSNFVVSLAYVMGIATTFALLGLMAAFTGQMFGTFMANPIVVFVIVALLLYLAFSMFGYYEMYIPRSLQNSNNTTVKGGSFLSLFLFGVVSGSVASPCLSPGLVLLLSIVTTLSSKILGFALLFAFGIGLGVPLLVVGTFSGSLNVLPKAGMWMIEIKKMFGIILIYMCFYFLKTIVSWPILLTMIAITTCALGVWLIYDAQKTNSTSWRWIKNILGMGAIACSIVMAAQVYKTTYSKQEDNASESSLWHHDYEKALDLACKENKKLFIDIGAHHCTICKEIDKKIFREPAVLTALQECVAFKLDGTDTSNPASARLTKEHNVMGFPTYLLLDPITQKVIQRWGAELYDSTPTLFVNELATLLQQ